MGQDIFPAMPPKFTDKSVLSSVYRHIPAAVTVGVRLPYCYHVISGCSPESIQLKGIATLPPSAALCEILLITYYSRSQILIG